MTEEQAEKMLKLLREILRELEEIHATVDRMD